MTQLTTESYLRDAGVLPLVRPTRNQAEIDLLPPYGDPEVSIPGEVGTYIVVGGGAVALAEWMFR